MPRRSVLFFSFPINNKNNFKKLFGGVRVVGCEYQYFLLTIIPDATLDKVLEPTAATRGEKKAPTNLFQKRSH